MLNPKSKRTPWGVRSTRLAEDDTAREDSIWSSLHSVSPPANEAIAEAPRVRLLRTADPKPSAPRLQDFFPRETRPIDRVITFWDPSSLWPKAALADLPGDGGRKPGATRLAQADSDQTFALVHHTVIERDGGLLQALLHVQASPVDAASADVALMLLERGDHAIVLTGNATEYRELPRRLQDFCRQAAWRGPTLQFISPQDKPSRADRLRKVSWPRSLPVQVVEMLPDATPGWLGRLLDRLFGEPRAPGVGASPAALDAPSAALERLPVPPPFTAEARAQLPQRPSAEACRAALPVVALAPGVVAVAVLDVSDHTVPAREGEPAVLEPGLRIALQLWGAVQATAEPAELLWTGVRFHHLALPVPAHPGLLLVGVIDRDLADLQQVRWQCHVALHEIAATLPP